MARDLRSYVREIPDYPVPGVVYRDITPLLLDPLALDAAVAGLEAFAEPLGVDLVVAPEARGFILGGALARQLQAGFVPARKPGKLPHEVMSAEYQLEYGVDTLEVHSDAFVGGPRVLVHDDVLATGGTVEALCELVSALGGKVMACVFLLELSFLGGRERLPGRDVYSLIDYEG